MSASFLPPRRSRPLAFLGAAVLGAALVASTGQAAAAPPRTPHWRPPPSPTTSTARPAPRPTARSGTTRPATAVTAGATTNWRTTPTAPPTPPSTARATSSSRPSGRTSGTCWNGTCQYTSAKFSTPQTFSQAYGHFEARMQLPRGQGMWPAFWMLGNDIGSVGWPNSGEIDIMENIGKEPGSVHGTIHGPGYSGANGIGAGYTLPGGQAFADGFHTFAVDWSPNSITWSVDGNAYETRTPADLNGNRWVFDHPFYIIMNLAVGGYWPGDPDGSTSFPQRLVVDYVHVTTGSPAPGGGGQITGLAGKCMDVYAANPANGTPVQLYDCNGTTAQQWTCDRRHPAGARQVPGRHQRRHRGRHHAAALGLQRLRRTTVHAQLGARHRQRGGEQVRRRDRQQLRQRNPAAAVDLHRRGQPEVDRVVRRTLAVLGTAAVLTGLVSTAAAQAAGETVNVWLTTTNDSGGRNVTRGLQQQTPVQFAPGTGTGQQTITVDENTTYQHVHRRRRVVHRHRRMADELQRRAVAVHPRRHDAQAVRPERRDRAELPAQPDGRVRPGALQLHLRRHARRAERPEPRPLHHRPRPGRRDPADQAGTPAQPAADGDGARRGACRPG